MIPDVHHSHRALAPDHRDALSVASGAVARASGSRYTCPMHPEIVRDAPGTCPKCGMALVPAT